MRTKVVVVPVALVPAENDELRLMVFAPGGAFLRAELGDHESPDRCVQELLGSEEAALDLDEAVALEKVAFLPAESSVTLLYTAALPLFDGLQATTSLPEASSLEDWLPLTPWVGRGAQREREDLPVEHTMVRNYWRRQLEETSAVLDFLPRYFTTNQVRAAYASLWGEEQHVGAFHRWLHDREAPKMSIVSQVSEKKVRNAADKAFAKVLKESDLGPQMQTSLTSFSPWGAVRGSQAAGVGLSAAVVATGGLGFLPVAVVAGAIAGKHVAYQQKVSRGKKPLWFTRALPNRILIDDPYAPRPRWLPTGYTPSAFH